MIPERAQRRAEEDLRGAHATVLVLTRRFSSDWGISVNGRWSPAEVVLHLVLSAEAILRELRIVAARGTRPKRRSSLLQRAALKTLLLTWRFPRGAHGVSGSAPNGLILRPSELERRSAAVTARMIELLRHHPPGGLAWLFFEHPDLGDLNILEWCRLLRAHARHHELHLVMPRKI